jgi:hypothetical protein
VYGPEKTSNNATYSLMGQPGHPIYEIKIKLKINTK